VHKSVLVSDITDEREVKMNEKIQKRYANSVWDIGKGLA
jgi:hypothetical protein